MRSNESRPRRMRATVSAAAVLLTAAVGLAACGGGSSPGSSSSSSTTASSASGSSSTTAGSSSSTTATSSSGGGSSLAAQLPAMKAALAAAEKPPGFNAPGPPIKISSVKGDKIFAMPVTSAIQPCHQGAKDLVTLAGKLGMSGKTFPNSGGPTAWVQGVTQALHQHYNAIALICGIDPQALKPQMQAAQKAGVPVVDFNLNDVSAPAPQLVIETTEQDDLAMRLSVDNALVHSDGKPIDLLMITSNENVPAPGMVAATKSEVQKRCGSACKLTVIDVPIPDWGTKIQSTVSSALLKDPKIQAVILEYDGMTPSAIPAVEGAHRSGLMIYTFGGGIPILQSMQKGGSLVASDFGPVNQLWGAYETMDQILRALTHNPPAPPSKAYVPSRLWTSSNVSDYFHPSNAFVGKFRALWGLSG